MLRGRPRFREYVVAYTNASTIVDEDYEDTEDLDGVFSGWDAETGTYDPSDLGLRGHGAAGRGRRARAGRGPASGERPTARTAPASQSGDPPQTDQTLEHPRCVFQVLQAPLRALHARARRAGLRRSRRSSSRASPTRSCATPGASAPRRSSTRSAGRTTRRASQYIRAASILQLLLGNIGRPGGGIMALRGHASIQGSTDIPTLYNILPGYLPMPHAGGRRDLDDYLENNTPPGGFWGTPASTW